MIRPIEELMAYYAFTIEDAQARKRPRLSATAKAMAVEFEAIMQNQNNLRTLSIRFGEEATLEELRGLAEVYLKNLVQNLVDVDYPAITEQAFDLAFEENVENFVRIQERDRLKKRFMGLEEEVLMRSNEVSDSEIFFNKRPKKSMFEEEAEPPRAKSEDSNLWKIIFLVIALAVAAMLIRFVWVLFKP